MLSGPMGLFFIVLGVAIGMVFVALLALMSASQTSSRDVSHVKRQPGPKGKQE